MTQAIAVSEHEGGVLELALNRPEAMNSMNMELLRELTACFTGLSGDEAVKGIVLSAKGKAFCTGGDLKYALAGQKAAGRLYELAAQFHAAVIEIRRIKKPVVAAVNGAAFGGGMSLALACDFRVVEESAVMSVGYCSRGLCPDGGFTFHLPKMVGQARALELLAFDRPISAQQALDWGLATQVAPDGQSVAAALELLGQMSEVSPHSFGCAKRLVNDSFHTTLETQLEMERLNLRNCAEHRDGQEGLAAFSEKRKPVF